MIKKEQLYTTELSNSTALSQEKSKGEFIIKNKNINLYTSESRNVQQNLKDVNTNNNPTWR